MGNRGREETQLDIKKPVDVSRRSTGHGLVSSPCRTPLGKKKEPTSPFLRAMESVQLGAGGCPVCWLGRGQKGDRQWGWEPVVGLQVSCKYPEILPWQDQTYCSAYG